MAWQTVFLSIGAIEKLPPLLIPLLRFEVVNGISSFRAGSGKGVPEPIAAIGYSGEFLCNCNYPVWIAISILTVGGIFCLAAKILPTNCKNKLWLIGNTVIKDYFLAVVAFSTLNIFYSAGIQLVYGLEDPISNNVQMTIDVLLPVIVVVLMLSSNPQTNHYFGTFRSHFK